MNPKVIFSDFDGTLTTKGHLSPLFFEVLEESNRMNAEFVVVSGRSISWGHFLLTHLPLRYVIMEGGGVILRKGNNKIITEKILVSSGELTELQETERALVRKFPNVLSADSYGRKTDRAVELFDINLHLKPEIESFLDDRKINHSSSNVHINFWVGEVSKFNGIETLLKEEMEGVFINDCVFFGDAPNDESVFAGMKHTVGVSNIDKYLSRMRAHPSVILKGEDNRGIGGVYNYLKSLRT